MSLFSKNKTKATDDKSTKPASMKDMYAEDVKVEAKKESGHKKDWTAISRAYRVLLRPIISEKASHQQTLVNQYFFMVDMKANKIEVAKAVKAVYGIKPVAVNIIKMEGKRSYRGRTVGKRKDWKKAIVTLPKGKTITLYEGV